MLFNIKKYRDFEKSHTILYLTQPSVSIVNFERVIAGWEDTI